MGCAEKAMMIPVESFGNHEVDRLILLEAGSWWTHLLIRIP